MGQSRHIIVKNCKVDQNVAGIEIENSFDADVFDNYATNNSGGISVFDLPGLEVHNGGRVRVFHNKVPKNNHPNFGAPGSSVSNVAPGTGMLLLAMDNVEIFDNQITDNNTAGLQIISYILTGNPINDPHYDPYPEHAYIHDNHISGGGKNPGGRYGKMLRRLLGKPFPEIFYDGVLNPKHLKTASSRPSWEFASSAMATCVCQHPFRQVDTGKHRGGQNRRGSQHRPLHGELSVASCRLPAAARRCRSGQRRECKYRSAPKKLSDYGLFEGNGRTQQPVAGLIPYESTRPCSPTTRPSTALCDCLREPRSITARTSFSTFPWARKS